jgi:transposase
MDHQTLRDWVHRYNADRLSGLSDRPRPGRLPRLSAEEMRELEALAENRLDPKTGGGVRWRRMDLASLIANRFHVRLHERTTGKLLHRLEFAKLSVRPQAGPVSPVPI